jgi:hypothetical protein
VTRDPTHGQRFGGDQRGFIAIEVLFGLLITGLLLTAMSRITVLLMQSESIVTERLGADEANWRTQTLLRQLLEEQVLTVEGQDAIPALRGTAEKLILASMGPRGLAAPAAIVFTIQVKQVDNAINLTLSWKDARTGKQAHNTIMRALRSAQFSYLATGGTAWLADWAGTNGQPIAIRLALLDEIGQARAFIVPVRTTLATRCASAPGNGACAKGFQ